MGSLTDITSAGVGVVMGLCGCQVVFQEKDLVWTEHTAVLICLASWNSRRYDPEPVCRQHRVLY